VVPIAVLYERVADSAQAVLVPGSGSAAARVIV
jgi:hypothetical protein